MVFANVKKSYANKHFNPVFENAALCSKPLFRVFFQSYTAQVRNGQGKYVQNWKSQNWIEKKKHCLLRECKKEYIV